MRSTNTSLMSEIVINKKPLSLSHKFAQRAELTFSNFQTSERVRETLQNRCGKDAQMFLA